jgi:prophage DNA circulation protein
MSNAKNFKIGSWRGVKFYYRGTTENRGFKNSLKLFPGSDNFVVEQLGRQPRKFTIDMQVENEDRDAFDSALNTTGSGLLVHPMYGTFTAKLVDYTKTDTIQTFGLYNYVANFYIEIGLIVPTEETLTTIGISAVRSEAVSTASSFLKSKFSSFGF